jgi:hypothetical protein
LAISRATSAVASAAGTSRRYNLSQCVSPLVSDTARAVQASLTAMIRIAISQAAFDAIAATMLFGNVNYEAKINAKGERLIWLEPRWVDTLTAMRGPGESYSDVIIRPEREEGGAKR